MGINIPLTEELIKPCNDTCSFCFLNYADLISNNYIFNDFKPKEVGNIIKHINHKVKIYDKGEIIIHNGDEIDNLLIIVKGSAVGEIMGFEGKILRVEELQAPDAIGCAFIYGKTNKIPYDVIAKEKLKALVIPKKDLLNLFMKNEKLLVNFFNVLTNRAHKQSNRLKILGLNTLKGKVAYHLLECAKENNSNSYKLCKTQNDLAEMFGVARPSIGRIFKELDDSCIIESKGKQITILDNNRLKELLK